MSLNPDALQAFLTIYEQGSFTRASEILGLTQSALSQKIARLESYLETTLFIRKTDGLELTSAGLKLLPYSKQLLHTEAEFLQGFHSSQDEIRGVLRLGSYSSILRSILIPTLSPFMRKHHNASIEFTSYEMDQLAQALKTGKVDVIVTDFFPTQPGCEEQEIGKEEYVLIESARHTQLPDVYLDHGPNDYATEAFFKFQGNHETLRRGFMGDVYGILDGVAQGLGRAVMSRHLIENDKRFKIIKTKKRFFKPVVLIYFRQSYYSKLQKEVLELLRQQTHL
ncbi:MAG: LysR family transcriptional regulator [Bdellovibrionales bacterium]|nr:LysR family transcriptional regulator [Bdellovibrionales bacterium]